MLVADASGESVDNKTRVELIKQQEQLIKKEAEEKEQEVRNQFSRGKSLPEFAALNASPT